MTEIDRQAEREGRALSRQGYRRPKVRRYADDEETRWSDVLKRMKEIAATG